MATNAAAVEKREARNARRWPNLFAWLHKLHVSTRRDPFSLTAEDQNLSHRILKY